MTEAKYYVKLSEMLNHYTLNQLIRFADMNPDAMVEINDGCAERELMVVER